MKNNNLVTLEKNELINTSGGSYGWPSFGGILLVLDAYEAFMNGVQDATCDQNPDLCEAE